MKARYSICSKCVKHEYAMNEDGYYIHYCNIGGEFSWKSIINANEPANCSVPDGCPFELEYIMLEDVDE